MSIRTSAKPICQACNRPFNPSSEGATNTMGPTCAKRVGHVAWDDSFSQLSFTGDLGEHLRPPPVKTKSRMPKISLPRELREAYQAAKTAFDELFRLNCGNGTLLHNGPALELETEIYFGGCDFHTLADPVLGWLEPEYQLQLLIDQQNQVAYHRREINGVVTMLAIPLNAPGARADIGRIVHYTHSVRRHYEGAQLSLLGE